MIFLGQCRELSHNADMPSIKSLIQKKELENKKKILKYLRNGSKGATAAGVAYDVLTGEPIQGEFCCFNDGEYVWRSDIIYYVEKYNLKLEPSFIKKCIEN